MPTSIPTFRRFFLRAVRAFIWFFTHRFLIRAVFVLISLVTLAALAVAFENWRTARAWNAWRTAAEARGVPFDLASAIPPLPPPERNFAATPLLASLFDYEIKPSTRPNVSGGEMVYHDPKNVERIRAIDLDRLFSYPTVGEKAPAKPYQQLDFKRWRKGEKTDFAAWLDHYRSSPEYPASAKLLAPPEAVLLALSKFDVELDELSRAAERPESVFVLHWNETAPPVPHIGVLGKLETLAVLRALAAGVAGDQARAFDGLMFAQRLAEALRAEPWEVSLGIRAVQHGIAMQPVWEALAERRLTAEQLAALQAELAGVNLVEHLARCVRSAPLGWSKEMEQARAGAFPDYVWSIELPGSQEPVRANALLSWLSFRTYRAQLIASRYNIEDILPTINTEARTLDLTAILAAGEKWRRTLKLSRMNQAGFAQSDFIETTEQIASYTARAQAEQNMAVIACALERWALAHGGGYPDSPAALVPELLAKVPIDPVNGQPLRYRRTGDGRFQLWSVGANLRDDGGTVALEEQRDDSKPRRISRDLSKGDWVWSYQKL